MAVDGVPRDEKTRSDLLVAEALRDKLCNLRLSLPQQSSIGIVCLQGSNVSGLTERHSDGAFPAQALPDLDLGLELRRPERRDR